MIYLNVEGYCHNCQFFEAVVINEPVSKFNRHGMSESFPESFSNEYGEYDYSVTCKNRFACEHVAEMTRRKQ